MQNACKWEILWLLRSGHGAVNSSGCLENDNLWTYDGRHVGRLVGGEIFDRNGRYLGELRENRLITALDKQTKTRLFFHPGCLTRPSDSTRRICRLYDGYRVSRFSLSRRAVTVSVAQPALHD
jgi:hypothetical protein